MKAASRGRGALRSFTKSQIVCLPALLSCFAAPAAAQMIALSGVLLDRMCYSEKHPQTLEEALKHRKVCMTSERCSASGYGLFTDDHRFLAFDASGNKRAAEFIRLFRGDSRVAATVVGNLRGPFLENVTL